MSTSARKLPVSIDSECVYACVFVSVGSGTSDRKKTASFMLCCVDGREGTLLLYKQEVSDTNNQQQPLLQLDGAGSVPK